LHAGIIVPSRHARVRMFHSVDHVGLVTGRKIPLGKSRVLFVVVAALAVFAACDPLALPGNTSSITFVSTTTTGGWKYDYYRDTAYPCSISGYQTFVIGTKVGSS